MKIQLREVMMTDEDTHDAIPQEWKNVAEEYNSLFERYTEFVLLKGWWCGRNGCLVVPYDATENDKAAFVKNQEDLAAIKPELHTLGEHLAFHNYIYREFGWVKCSYAWVPKCLVEKIEERRRQFEDAIATTNNGNNPLLKWSMQHLMQVRGQMTKA